MIDYFTIWMGLGFIIIFLFLTDEFIKELADRCRGIIEKINPKRQSDIVIVMTLGIFIGIALWPLIMVLQPSDPNNFDDDEE